MSTVTKLHLLGGSTGGKGQELVTQANTEDGGACSLKSLGQVADSDSVHDGITRTVGNEETVVVGIGIEIIVPRNNLDLDAASDKAANLVEFLLRCTSLKINLCKLVSNSLTNLGSTGQRQ